MNPVYYYPLLGFACACFVYIILRIYKYTIEMLKMLDYW